jgi:hypothetical protein
MNTLLEYLYRDAANYKRHGRFTFVGAPPVEGYKPRWNYQELIRDIVEEQVANDREPQRLLELEVDREAGVLEVDDILSSWVASPAQAFPTEPSVVRERARPRPSTKVDYLEREARKRLLGEAAESASSKSRRHPTQRRPPST